MAADSSSARRVVVTGLGAVTPLGLSAQESFESAVNGRSGVGTITQFDTTDYSVKIAGEIKNFNPDLYVPKKDQKKMDRFLHLAMAASSQALQDCGIEFSEELKLRTGVFIGCGIGGLPALEQTTLLVKERGPSRISPFFIPQVIVNMASGHVSIYHGFKGPNFSMVSACATGCHSIGEAANYIRSGHCDVMVSGGAESTICGLGIGGFAAMKALSTRNDSPAEASRPWDQDRDGFIMSEGAAVLILEEYEHAKARGAKIYAEVTGYGISSDAYHMTNPAPGGAGAVMAMKQAIASAKLNPEQIGYVNAHGTSTSVGDLAESEAIKVAFGDSVARKTWISSTKSMTGHTLGAAGAIESIFSILTLGTGKVPPTINLHNPSPDCDLDYVPNVARERQLQHVLNNSFGFGGTNACLVFSKI